MVVLSSLRIRLAIQLARDTVLARMLALATVTLSLDLLTTWAGLSRGASEAYPGAHALMLAFGSPVALAVVLAIHLALFACLWQLAAIWPACRRLAFGMAGLLLATHAGAACWNLAVLAHAYLG